MIIHFNKSKKVMIERSALIFFFCLCFVHCRCCWFALFAVIYLLGGREMSTESITTHGECIVVALSVFVRWCMCVRPYNDVDDDIPLGYRADVTSARQHQWIRMSWTCVGWVLSVCTSMLCAVHIQPLHERRNTTREMDGSCEHELDPN